MTNLTKNLTVKWRMTGFACFMLLLIIGAGIGGLHGMLTANRSLAKVYQNHVLPLKEFRSLESLFQDTIVPSVNKALSKEITPKQALRDVEKAYAQINAILGQLISTMSVQPDNKKDNWLMPVESLMEKTEQVVAGIVASLEDADFEKLASLSDKKLDLVSEDYKSLVNDLVQASLAAAKREFEQDQKRYEVSKTAFVVTLLIGIFISLLASVILIRGINRPLSRITQAMDYMMIGDLTKRLQYEKEDEFGVLIDGYNQMIDYLGELVSQIQRSGIQVTSSITQLAATNKQQETLAAEHAATTSEMAASSTEIAATGANLKLTTKKVRSLTQNAAFAASEGHSGLRSIDEKMVMLDESTSAVVNTLSDLSEKANNIAGVVMTINKIADQTNLLSLNAAIEAEKAGEYGAGFSVVANEIRRLADQTAIATYDIEQMVKEVQSAISASVMGIDNFAEGAQRNAEEIRNIAEQLAGAIELVEVLSPQVETLAEGIEAQTLGAEQISDAINMLNEAAQQSAESITQTSTSISHLHRAALLLQEGVERFKVDSDEESGHVTSYI